MTIRSLLLPWLAACLVLAGAMFSTGSLAATPAATASGRDPARDAAEIQALIARVAQSRGVVFIRNGSTHSASEAAAHLRRKLGAAHGRVHTAEQFIEYLGTRSSFTGIAYRVRFTDGREMPSAQWLQRLLHALREARAQDALKPPAPPATVAPVPAHAGR